MSNNDKLRALMKANNLTYQDTADISGYSINTIQAYMLPDTSKASRNLSNRAYELISHKIDTMRRVLDKEP